jgi:hypothetical protein
MEIFEGNRRLILCLPGGAAAAFVAVMLPDSTHSREIPVVAIILSMMIWSIRRRQ